MVCPVPEGRQGYVHSPQQEPTGISCVHASPWPPGVVDSTSFPVPAAGRRRRLGTHLSKSILKSEWPMQMFVKFVPGAYQRLHGRYIILGFTRQGLYMSMINDRYVFHAASTCQSGPVYPRAYSVMANMSFSHQLSPLIKVQTDMSILTADTSFSHPLVRVYQRANGRTAGVTKNGCRIVESMGPTAAEG